MKLLSILFALGFVATMNAQVSHDSKEELRLVIAGVEDGELIVLFSALGEHYHKELGEECLELGWGSVIRLLNIERDAETGNVGRVTFSRGKFFVSFSPLEKTAHSSVYLEPGFEYEVDLKVGDGKALVTAAGTVSLGAEPFEVE
ncbi:MAG: hypothetical protein E1N59_597 [Puniceicoccaceae bacterium 5H]|nr:MAG: hypothetical protein E1N59_597 [Puniceicoccaceae bacterium 5H]